MQRVGRLAEVVIEQVLSSATRPPRHTRAFASDSLQGSLTACLEASRAVVRVEGSQAIQFLQGMVTNDMRPLEAPGAAPVYATLLTPKGKFLHDLIFYRQQDGSLLMEVDSTGKQRALDWLTRYRLRKQVQMHDLSGEQAVWVQFGAQAPPQQEGWWPDPRLPALGLRTIQPPTTSSPSSTPTNDVTQGLYRTWRHMHGVAEGEVEMPTEKAAPLDYNLDVLQGVSYKKGCYIGQERNSFTHYRGVIRKRCMSFTYDQGGPMPVQGETIITENPPQPTGTDVQGSGAAVQGTSVGTVQGVSQGHGLGYVRLKPALLAAAGQGTLRGKVSGARVVPFRPGWWDETWGYEEEGDGGGEV